MWADQGEAHPLPSVNTFKEPMSYQYVPHRGLTRETLEYYGVTTKVDAEGTPVCTSFPYGERCIKVRPWTEKSFHYKGEAHNAPLFGQDRFTAGSAKTITITEGEYDAMSVYQMLGPGHPCVSVRGANSARRDCENARDYLNSFERVYLCLDADRPGQEAAQQVSELFGSNKVVQVQLTKYKDANDYLVNGEQEEFSQAWANSKPHLPGGIVGDFATLKEAMKKPTSKAIATYPFPTLQAMTHGIRTGELVLFTALEKVGKTEVFRAIEHHVLTTEDFNIGIIHLEEDEKRSIQGFASYELDTPVHLPDAPVSDDDAWNAFEKLVKREGRCYFYTHFASSDPNTIMDRIRYMVTVCGCKLVFLDHLSRLVSSEPNDDVRRTLDWIATSAAVLAKQLNFCFFIISHVNDDGKPRDSRMIAKECNLHVYLSRDKESADAATRNTVSLMVRDNRFGGITGPAGTLTFDPKTFKLAELPRPAEIEFNPNV